MFVVEYYMHFLLIIARSMLISASYIPNAHPPSFWILNHSSLFFIKNVFEPFLFFDSFTQALECLVRLASVRRSLFTNDAARSKFLAHLMTGTKEILQTGQGMRAC